MKYIAKTAFGRFLLLTKKEILAIFLIPKYNKLIYSTYF